MNKEEISNYKKSGEIAREVVAFAKSFIKPEMKLFDIAEKIESKIKELGAIPAFPCNLSINDIAAHFTPSYNDNTKASGLLKIDIGVSVLGYIADTAFSIDLENSEENKKLIEAASQALNNALQILKPEIEICKIGEIIHKTIISKNLSPIINLSGHSLEKNEIHAGVTIPNYDNGNKKKLEQGAYAIEPFSTNGEGKVYEGKPSSIFMVKIKKAVRDSFARKLLEYIEKEYETLPFCARWLEKEFGSRVGLALSNLEKEGVIYQFPQLIEKAHGKVAQAEHTFLVNDKIEITT